MKSSLHAIATTLSLALFRAAASFAQTSATTAMDDQWHFLVAPYVWGTGMKGTVGTNEVIAVPVDLSFGDAISNLDFGVFGRFEGRKDRLGFWADVAYLNLGTNVTGPVAERVAVGADVRSLTTEGVLNWRFVNDDTKGGCVEALAGVRYMGNRAILTATRGGDEIEGSGKSLNWVDAMAGARFRVPLGGKLGLHGSADIAGFGSDFTWNVLGHVEVPVGKTWRIAGGYRYMDVDYDKGAGLDRRMWKITYQGPYLTAAKAW